MKFLLITANDIDGVGQHAISLSKHLQLSGHKSKVLVLNRIETNTLSVVKIKRSLFLRIFSFLFYDFIKKDFYKLFTFANSTTNYQDIEKHVFLADVIIIYSMHKILSFKFIKKIFDSGKIVYLRPLDMEFATGGCHVNLINNDEQECNKYTVDCNHCPQLNKLNIFNISKKIFLEKKYLIQKYKPRVLVENTYTQKLYNQSKIFNNHRVEKVFLGTNLKRQKSISKYEARRILNLNQKDKIMLFGTFNLEAKHKGGNILPSILNKLNKLIVLNSKNKNKTNVKLITFGKKKSFNINLSEIDWVHLGLISSSRKLNLLYRAADVLLSPATSCNGPHIVSEAVANDLPVIAFDVGVAQDNVINNKNGFLIPCFKTSLFSNCIYKSLYLKKFHCKKINKKLKQKFNSFVEAKTIINLSYRDKIQSKLKKGNKLK